VENNRVLFGYGYGDIIPVMDDPQRKGEDGTNENVHNFVLNIFARGGLLHLLIYTFIIFEIYKISKIANNQSLMLLLILPIFVVSFFDASMENPHFPFLFYFFLGRLTNELKL
jgi:O-antigen ligase